MIFNPEITVARSANARNAHVESALEAGMVGLNLSGSPLLILQQDDVVSKPFRIPELVPKIKSLVEKSGAGKS